MYLDFFNLREEPFGVTPDPRYLYLSPTHREALASLLYGIRSNRGFMTLIAQPGMGKTTLLFCLLERLRNSSKTAFLFHTQCNSQELLRHLLADLGIENISHDTVEMHQQLNKFLIGEAQNGRRVVVIIDEAQNLSDEVLESVRLLSNFETASAKLIHVILAGQPPLADKLARPALAQLRQRLSIMARLEPFTPADTDHYIHHRLWVSGHNGKREPFTAEARALIAACSEGIPRNINNLCFNALSLGFAMQKGTIDGEMVREVVADRNIASLGSERPAASANTHLSIPPPQLEPVPQTGQDALVGTPSLGSEQPLSANTHPVVLPAQSEPAPQAGHTSLQRALALAGEDSQLTWSPPAVPVPAGRPANPKISSVAVHPVSFSPVEKVGLPRRALQVALVGALLIFLGMFAIRHSAKEGWPNSTTVMAAAAPSPTATAPAASSPTPVVAALPPTIWSAAASLGAAPVAVQTRDISSITAGHYSRRSAERVAKKTQQLNSKLTGSDPIERGQFIPPSIAQPKDKPVGAPEVTDSVAAGGVLSGVQAGAPVGTLDGGTKVMAASAAPYSPPQLPQPFAPKPFRVGGQLEAAKLIFQPKTEYPSSAERARIQGLVRLEAVISKDGTIEHLRVLSGHPLLVKSALKAVQRWRYRPTLLNGEPVESVTELAVNFTLRGTQ